MTRLFALVFAALFLAVAAPQTARAQTPAAAPFVGLTPESVHGWLASAGAELGDVTRENGDVYFEVRDGGTVWFVFFYGCETDGRCGDLQFNAIFDGTGVSTEAVNDWNRSQRWLKAFRSETDGQTVVFVQQDVMLVSGQAVEQLADPTLVWLQGLGRVSEHLREVAGAMPTS
jgi:hypothetical protein